MTRRPLLSAVFVLAALSASAQVQMHWAPVHGKVALYEPIPVRVTVINESGVPLDFSPGGNAALSFGISDEHRTPVRTTGEPLAVPPVVVGDGETKTIAVDLLPAYQMRECLHYAVTPRIHAGRDLYEGEKKDIEIRAGNELVRRSYGMAGNEGRIVSLVDIPRNRATHLLCRIDSTDGYCLAVQDLGTSLRLFPPRLERDNAGLFHILHQCAPRTFAHTVFRPDGTRERVRYYQGDVSGMRLARTAEGKVSVTGGIAYEEDADSPGVFTAPDSESGAVTDFSTDMPVRERGVGTPQSWWRGGGQ